MTKGKTVMRISKSRTFLGLLAAAGMIGAGATARHFHLRQRELARIDELVKTAYEQAIHQTTTLTADQEFKNDGVLVGVLVHESLLAIQLPDLLRVDVTYHLRTPAVLTIEICPNYLGKLDGRNMVRDHLLGQWPWARAQESTKGDITLTVPVFDKDQLPPELLQAVQKWYPALAI